VKALPSLGRLGWMAVGGLVVLLAALSVWPEPILYPEVIVRASDIYQREGPFSQPTIRDRLVYVYVQPDVRAIAPGAVTEDVARFCRPTLVAQTDTVRPTEMVASVIRSVVYSPSLVPLLKGSLLVTSMDGHGNLIAEDYRARAPFRVAAGLREPYHTQVRYPRWAAPVDYARGALELYGAFRLFLDVVR